MAMVRSIWANPWMAEPTADFREQVRMLPADPEPALSMLRSLAGTDLNLDQLSLLARTIKQRTDAISLLGSSAPFRLTVLGNYTTGFLVEVLPAVALRHGLAMSVVETAYDQLPQETFGEGTTLKTSAPDAVFVALDHRQFGLRGALARAEEADAQVDDALRFLGTLIEALDRDPGAPLILHTFPQTSATLTGSFDAVFPGSLRAQLSRLNAGLRAFCGNQAHYLLDLESLAAQVGLSSWHDARLWQAAKIPYALDAVPLVAEHLCRIAAAIRGKARKSLVFDLDNTLWGGVVGDDGLEGIQISQASATGEAFRAVQAFGLEQRMRGVVLAVCSKNEHDTVLRVFRDHPDMLLREADIAAFQVNWEDKATNLLRIAESLNIGVDSLVFVDDNPAERDRVRQVLPMVAVPELPDDPAAFAPVLWAASYFEAITLSDEDFKRADSYKGNLARVATLSQLGDTEAYLASLEMAAIFAPFDPLGRSRIAQLINKSNQFNLTTRRYTESEVAAIEVDPNRFHLQVRLTDKFGDNGMVSVVIFDKRGNVWECDTWLMSCRVLGRRLEEAILAEVVTAARAEGAEMLSGCYVPSRKNAMVATHFGKLGFAKLGEDSDGKTRWQLCLANYTVPSLPMRIIVQ